MKLLTEYEQHQEIFNFGYRFNPQDEIFYTDNIETFKHPEGYSEWKVQKIDTNKYLNERLKELGVKEKDIQVNLFDKDGQRGEMPIFTANKHGDIEILFYNLERKCHLREVKTTSAGTKFDYKVQKRLNPLYALFCKGKYDFWEAINAPFWHKSLIEAFEEGTEIETLTITEGQFKAFKASNDGIPTVGLTSIFHSKQSETKELHTEIIQFIIKCKVQKVVVLWDGDSRDISSKDLERGRDLTKRPGRFYKQVKNIRESLYKFVSPKKVKIFYATIKSASIEGEPKGIDDLLIVKNLPAKKIREEFANIGTLPGHYIDWMQITTDPQVKIMHIWFKLDYVGSFYQHHSEQIKNSSFVFDGNTYKIVKGVPVMEISADLKEYKIIGTDYYRLTTCTVPTGKKGEVVSETALLPWKPDMIKLQHGKDALHKLEVYKRFTNIPSHIEYKPVINNEWNLYFNVQHEKKKGDFPTIKTHLKHVFQEHYDMIIDYITVLYKYPMQKLPVICLLSKEQGTGKSTFLFLMKLLFKQNMAIVSNSDITGEFNSFWTSKLIAACEETVFDKKEAYEKIKAYTTQKSITRNEKNKSQTEIPCMLHFILCSNHENDFMKISKYDRRLWVRKVQPFKKRSADADITFDDRIEAEVPAFVDFIENREVQYKERGELFFHQTDFQTDAFKNLVANSDSELVKEIKESMIDYFLKWGTQTIELTAADLLQYFGISSKFGKTYINKVLEQEFDAVRNTDSKGKSKVDRYTFNDTNPNDLDQPITISKTGRFWTLKREWFINDNYAQEMEEELEEESKYIQTSIPMD